MKSCKNSAEGDVFPIDCPERFCVVYLIESPVPCDAWSELTSDGPSLSLQEITC